jgi:hypothetical protein
VNSHNDITHNNHNNVPQQQNYHINNQNENSQVIDHNIAQHNINNMYNQDYELRQNLNNEILKLRTNFIDQQNTVIKQINDLKTETQNANLQRYEALKEISLLKDELSKQRVDEELRRKYVYDIMVDNTNKTNAVYSNSKLPDLNPDDFKMELPLKKNHMKNIHEYTYEDSIKYPNRPIPVPRLDELKENEFRVSSKFIDIDTHKVYDPTIDKPNFMSKKEEENQKKVRNKGLELDDDFISLRSYQRDNHIDKIEEVRLNNSGNDDIEGDVDLGLEGGDYNSGKYYMDQKDKYQRISSSKPNKLSNYNHINRSSNKNLMQENVETYANDNIEHNKIKAKDDSLSINQIYNKNMERLRWLNGLNDE